MANEPKLAGMFMTRNSEWVLGASTRAALKYCDVVVILDHVSTDSTPAISQALSLEYPGRVVYIKEETPDWDEMDFRQRILDACREVGATHVANIDDDEILTANLIPYMRDWIQRMPPGEALDLPWLCMWDGLNAYRADGSSWSSTYVSFLFADGPGMHYKAEADGYHYHRRRPRGNEGKVHRFPEKHEYGGLMHLQFSSRRRLNAKQALYKMTELLRWPEKRTIKEINQMYDNTTLAPGLKTKQVPDSWWQGQEELQQYIDLEAIPWQEAECKRLWELHGSRKFTGLNLYGVVK